MDKRKWKMEILIAILKNLGETCDVQFLESNDDLPSYSQAPVDSYLPFLEDINDIEKEELDSLTFQLPLKGIYERLALSSIYGVRKLLFNCIISEASLEGGQGCQLTPLEFWKISKKC